MIEQPVIEITKGKVKRTISEQATLEFNSHVKKYLDKGYKCISDYGYTSLENFDENVVPKSNTDQKGLVKPMLCEQYDFNDSKLEKITWKASTKLDGLRTMLYYKDGVIYTSSRGGKDYNVAATYIREDVYLKSLFESNPNLILDGELYKHGWNLQKISGLGRLETLHDDHKELKFYCYDIVDESATFEQRYNRLQTFTETDKFILVQHVDVKGNDNIKTLHDRYISEGYEGLVLRDPSKTYKCGSRSNRMLKVKEFVDAEFEVIDLVEGLRDEDMCFLLTTKEGNTFKAKPIGDRQLKQWYRDNLELLIGKMATVKYFGFTNTENPVPNLPVLKSFRINEDM
jgi:DNA ligase-1